MKIAAIIAEYNPLHGGHVYHIEQTRQRTGAEYIVTILSGDFVQRGLPAVEEKFMRAKKALEAGSDLVLELPLPYALSSAEGFAFGGVSLANALGCVDYLSFGLEDASNLEAMKELARAMNANSYHFQALLKSFLADGLSYPAAVSQAAAAAFPEINTRFLIEKGNSNMILALEYLRALDRLGSSITPAAITRRGMSYLDDATSAFQCRADNRRSQYTGKTTFSDSFSTVQNNNKIMQKADGYPSATALRVLLQASEPSDSPLLFPSDFSVLLHYKLLSQSYEELLQYRKMTPQLAHKIINTLPEYENYEQFANLLWTKDITYSRVCRELLYIFLDLKKDTWDVHTQVPYARILGFRKSASPLLHQIRESASIPLISRLADASNVLPDDAQSLLNLEIKTSQIYDSVRYHKCGERLPGEYQKQIIISS